jgi:hypothetical protein
MYILNQKIKNKWDTVSNLDHKNLDSNALRKRYLKRGQLKHNPDSVKEWCNSVYGLGRNNYVKTLPLKDILIYKMFNTYFNLDKLKEYDNLSMSKIFVGKPEVKHFNNKIHITLYIFNKWIVRFYKTTNMLKSTETLFSLENKQFIFIENKLFVMAILLLKYYKFNKKSIGFIKELLVKLFNCNNNNNYNNGNKSVKILYKYIITFFDKVKLHDLLRLNKYTNTYIENSLVNSYKSGINIKVINRDLFKLYKINKNTKMYLYLYLCIIYYFFNYIGLPKMINILRKVAFSKEKETNNSVIMLKSLHKVYSIKLGVNSSYLLFGLVNFFLNLKKILKTIYLMKWYKRNVYYIRYKLNLKNILLIKSILNKLYNNSKIEINIINLKYLYLDGNILALTVVKKLKNRKRRVLKVIRMALRLSKKPHINKFYSKTLNTNNLDNVFIKKDFNTSINNIPFNRDLTFKPISYKSRIILFYLKHKVISGLKLQGTGRLTKRLTASRSVSKSIGKGSLKNRASSYNGLSTLALRGYVKSNLQYININSYNRIGAYGVKSWISSY